MSMRNGIKLMLAGCGVGYLVLRFAALPLLDWQTIQMESEPLKANLTWRPSSDRTLYTQEDVVDGVEHIAKWNRHYLSNRTYSVRFNSDGTVDKLLKRSYFTVEGSAQYHIKDGIVFYENPEGSEWLFPPVGEPIRHHLDGYTLYTPFGQHDFVPEATL